MQTSLMFVDLMPLGSNAGSQKLAIKMPEGAGDFDLHGEAGFSEMINALMAMTPEQLQTSFGEMEWVKVNGESTGYAPLLDLSIGQGGGNKLAQTLFGELAHHKLPSNANTPIQVHPENNGTLGNERGAIMPSTVEQVISNSDEHFDASQSAMARSMLNSTPKGESQTVGNANMSELPPKVDVQGESKTAETKIDPEAFAAIRSQAAQSTRTTAHNELSMGDKESVGRGTNTLGKMPAENADANPKDHVSANPKDLTATPLVSSEKINKVTPSNDSTAGRGAAFQNTLKVDQSTGQTADQQFGDGSDHEQELGARIPTRGRSSSETMRQNFTLSQGDVSLESTTDGTDPLSSSKGDTKAIFQQVAPRAKGAPVQSVEHTSSSPEPSTHTSETQNNVIRQIVQRMTLHQQGAQSTMTLKLKPAFLGNVHMQISTENQQVVVRMATESAAVKEMVEQGLQHLKTEMQHHGLEIDKFDVYVAKDNEESRPGQDLAGFRQALKKRQQNAMNKGQEGHHDEDNEASGKQAQRLHGSDSTSEIDYFA